MLISNKFVGHNIASLNWADRYPCTFEACNPFSLPGFILFFLQDRTGGGGATYHGITALLTGRTKEFDMQVLLATETQTNNLVVRAILCGIA